MFLLARVETTEMSLQYLEKIRSKLRSLTLSDSSRPSANFTNSNQRQAINEKHCQQNKCIGLKTTRCWSPQKTKSPKEDENISKKKTSSLPIEKEADNEAKTVFTMSTSRSQPSPKMAKRNEEKKVKKLKKKEMKLFRENIVKSWDETEASKQVGKIRKKWGWEKREGELMKKRTNDEVLENMKESVESRAREACKCGKAKNITVVLKNFCECEKVDGSKAELEKLCASYRKRKPKTAPHLTDSLIVYKERLSRKSDRYDKAEDEVMDLPVKKKEGKGVSFSKDVVFRKRKNMEESLITLYQNSGQKKSACGLTKEQFEKIKSTRQENSNVKGKLL